MSGKSRGFAEKLFFIVGCPRSGTTLLQRVLSAHPDVAVAPETFFMRQFWARREEYGDLQRDAHLDRLVDDLESTPAFQEMGIDAGGYRAAAREGDRTWQVLFGELLRQFAEEQGVRRVGEKTPNHVLYIPTLRQWFPEAKFVHLVRDPRAVANSWRTVPWSSGYRWRDAEVWTEYVGAGRRAGEDHPGAVTSVHFETLVRKPESTLRALCSFLEMPYEDRMLSFHEQTADTVNVEREPWKERTTDPIDPDVADRWRTELSRAEQAEVEAVAGSEMKRWGYAPELSSWRRWGAGGRVQVEWLFWKADVVLNDIWNEDEDQRSSSGSSRPFTIGFLHLGEPSHGVTRYGRVLAEAAKEHLDVRVREVFVTLEEDLERQEEQLREAAQGLASCHLVHAQYNQRIWGEPIRAPFNVRAFVRACDPPFVLTLHDVPDGYGGLDILRRLWQQRKGASNGDTGSDDPEENERSIVSFVGRKVRKGFASLAYEIGNAWATHHLAKRAAHVLVCTEEEARRARGSIGGTPLSVVPHFVEERPRNIDNEEAKRSLDLDNRHVLGVLGYIHRRKGYDLVVEALPFLTKEVEVVFIGRGGKNSQDYAARLEERAQALGEDDRLRITGYVSEETLNQYLAATDLALCPFREASASGSLATWIAAERPILASDLPLFAEYNQRVPEAIATFEPYTPEALADRAMDVLRSSGEQRRERLCALRESLAVSEVIAQHCSIYRRAAEAGF